MDIDEIKEAQDILKSAGMSETKTLRDEMAMAVLQGILANTGKQFVQETEHLSPEKVKKAFGDISGLSYCIADAMMKERNRT